MHHIEYEAPVQQSLKSLKSLKRKDLSTVRYAVSANQDSFTVLLETSYTSGPKHAPTAHQILGIHLLLHRSPSSNTKTRQPLIRAIQHDSNKLYVYIYIIMYIHIHSKYKQNNNMIYIKYIIWFIYNIIICIIVRQGQEWSHECINVQAPKDKWSSRATRCNSFQIWIQMVWRLIGLLRLLAYASLLGLLRAGLPQFFGTSTRARYDKTLRGKPLLVLVLGCVWKSFWRLLVSASASSGNKWNNYSLLTSPC